MNFTKFKKIIYIVACGRYLVKKKRFVITYMLNTSCDYLS